MNFNKIFITYWYKGKDLLFLYKGKKIEIKNEKLLFELNNNNIKISIINKQMNKKTVADLV